jgi:hypothetical protein
MSYRTSDFRFLDEAATTLPTFRLAMLEDPEKVAVVIDQAAKQVLTNSNALLWAVYGLSGSGRYTDRST